MKRATLIALLGLAAAAVACGGSKNKFEDSPELQGKPPSPDEDPFFYAALPPPSARADTSGTIGEARAERARRNEPSPDEVRDLEELRDRVRRAEVARDNAESEALALHAENLELKQRLDNSRPAATSSDLNQCHACVRICPVEGRCSDDAELVCGWGAGKDRKDAMSRATAECDGALEQLRVTGPWTRIEGKCPVARCF